ncbi:protein ALP1-like [Salvia splendens]|uniref:protein ALP1-like n=1 Tax=Salvia splendens TaxID=180675 RepID=UPI001C267D1A|nr:protein ALP1-like [Salvia splendens]
MNPGDDTNSSSSSDESSNSIDIALNAVVETAMTHCYALMQRQAAAAAASEQVHRPIRHRSYIRRDHAEAHTRLVEDYFADQPRWGPAVFRRRFRMSRYLFLSIVRTLSSRDEFFTFREDGIGKPGLTPLQKCTVALRQLAYGTTADLFDEYLHCGDSTGRDCLKRFCRGIVEAYGDTYLRKPTATDCQGLMQMHETAHGFPGMLGSIDCMHWQWKNCPTAWRGQFTSGYKGSHPTMVLEAVADHRLWIWHAYFGVAGSNNDINVLNSSTLFTDQCNGNGPAIEFTANRRQYHMGYYLADGIYPRWPVFVKTVSCPIGEKRVLFAQKQESARKDVERTFGVLQSRWAIVKGPARFWFKDVIADVIYACIIMHNMIVENEGGSITDWNEDDRASSLAGASTEPPDRGLPLGFNEVLSRQASMRNQQDHAQLMNDMIEEVWARNRRC